MNYLPQGAQCIEYKQSAFLLWLMSGLLWTESTLLCLLWTEAQNFPQN